MYNIAVLIYFVWKFFSLLYWLIKCPFMGRKSKKKDRLALPSVDENYSLVLSQLDCYADFAAGLEEKLRELGSKVGDPGPGMTRRSPTTNRNCRECLRRLEDHAKVIRSYQRSENIGLSYSNVYKLIVVADRSVQTEIDDVGVD